MTGVIAPAETTLCRIFADVLGLDLVRPDEAFFDVGGDSVLALQVVARARAAGLALSVRDLFDHQTPETLAAVTHDLPDAAGVSGGAAPAEPPLLAFSVDDFEEFEDTELDEFAGTEFDQQASDTEAGWETVT
jgi:aryl carrier-like protein